MKLFFRDLVREFSIRDPLQTIKEKFPAKGCFVDEEKCTKIQKKEKQKYHKPAIRCRNQDTEEKFKKKKYAKCQQHTDPADGVSGEKFDQFTGFLKAKKEKMQAFAKQAVFPEGVCLDSADQA